MKSSWDADGNRNSRRGTSAGTKLSCSQLFGNKDGNNEDLFPVIGNNHGGGEEITLFCSRKMGTRTGTKPPCSFPSIRALTFFGSAPTLQFIPASVCCHSNWKQRSFAANFGSGIGSNAGLSFDNWRQQWQRLWQQTESCCQKWQQEWQRFGSTNLAAAKRGGSFHIPSARTR